MAKQKWNPAYDYGQFALCAAGAGLVSSVVTGSVLPVLLVGVGLFLLFGFFSGIISGASGQKRRFA